MNNLWTEHKAAEATNGKAQGAKWNAARVVIDSRITQKGDLFVAIKGDNFDGHQFVKDALAKGAVAAVVSHVGDDYRDAPLVVVNDTLKALEGLGRYARKRSKAKVVGITGSVGKTSAKEMVRLALSAHGSVYATTGNLNNHIGTPLNLANLPPETEFAVFEMGMNHAGEIAHLTEMVQPDVAAITTVEAVHIEFFDSIDGIARAKAEIFDSMNAKAVAVINRDNPQWQVIRECAAKKGISNLVFFGTGVGAQCRLEHYAASAHGSEIKGNIHGTSMSYRIQAIGKHWAMTSLLTLAVTHALGLDDQKTIEALANFGELEGRGRILPLPVKGGEAILIDDSYNASPAAMRAAFAKTAEVWESIGRKGRKLAALGNMLELGKDAPQLHTDLAADIVKHGFDGVYTAGNFMQHLHDVLPPQMCAGHVEKAMDLLPLLQKELRAGDILLIKGSHGSKMYELAKALQDKRIPKEVA
jgi:UDP-N-acetylmuramoyl-tripeptide--D-alanyl-D-alanine ligase